jgi:DNA-binding NarL/FixJ family response regulator
MRVVIADHHQILRVGLRVVLEQSGDIRVVGEASNGLSALSLVALEQPDVAILDLNLPDGSGLALVPALLAAAPALRVLLLSVHENPELVRRSFAAGVHGYLSELAEPDELIQAVRSLAAGRAVVSVPLERARRADFLAFDQPHTRGAVTPKIARPLSGRERQVLELFAQGHTHRQIADILGVRAKTVETYRSRLGDKFGVSSRAELVYNARELGLLRDREIPPAG